MASEVEPAARGGPPPPAEMHRSLTPEMKRSRINAAVREAAAAFGERHQALPPNPRWDVTDFGLGDFDQCGLTLVNLTEQPEYCEKLMYARRNQVTPMHHHASKKEDIICRWGRLAMRFASEEGFVRVQVNGEERQVPAGRTVFLEAGWRVTIPPMTAHEFWAESECTIIGEVSTANDDAADNFFADPRVGRFSAIEEDEDPIVKLVSD